MHWKEHNEGELRAVLSTLESLFADIDVDFYLIGAIARDYWYSKGKISSRATRDIDFAILMSDAEKYQAVRSNLIGKGYNETGENAYVLISPSGIQVDLLPFGEIANEGRVVVEGEGMTNIQVDGFQEVYAAGTADADLTTGHVFKAATLSSIVLLKLIAYDDRPERRIKDAGDIAGIIRHFFELHSELIYDQHIDLFNSNEIPELEEIAALVIGREMKKICIQNDSLKQRLNRILDQEINKDSSSRFLIRMVEETRTDIEVMKKLLENMVKGLR